MVDASGDNTHPSHANTIDVHVGARIAARRQLISMSEHHLAKLLGITLEEVQQIESGRKRAGAQVLLKVSDILRTSVHYYFIGLAEPEQAREPEGPDGDSANIVSKTTFEIVRLCSALDDDQRATVLQIIREWAAPSSSGYTRTKINDSD